ncbi:hypothetical protein [Reyranella soli]|uniref:Uncharacterized protein n=1 Tax=Reyranella soli TaxID=1230389 RepID=A0A512NEG8_9HYPH|nr:hypothetical protein [Reyranella soli]GEP57339.1 hypothetical protein RSO01_45050 [Reyranella soli]
MTENLELAADDAAARATRKMMQGTKRHPADGLAIDPAGLQATIATLYIMTLSSLSFWIEQGLPVESVCKRLDTISQIFPPAQTGVGLENLAGIREYLRSNADQLKG